jgi:hypothetical protein
MDEDLYYTFTYHYGNGDSYNGFGLTNASDGYYPGQIISSPEANETGNIGYYEIISTHNYGYDTGYTEGAVHVVSYIDGESSNEPHLTYNFTNFNLAAGNAGLGSENFYIFDYPDPEAFNSFNEADLTSNTVQFRYRDSSSDSF